MNIKFYKVKSKEEIYEDEDFLFETEVEIIPSRKDTIYDGDNVYKVINVCHKYESDAENHYTYYGADIYVKEEW